MLVFPAGLLNHFLLALALFSLFPAGVPGPLILIFLVTYAKERKSHWEQEPSLQPGEGESAVDHPALPNLFVCTSHHLAGAGSALYSPAAFLRDMGLPLLRECCQEGQWARLLLFEVSHSKVIICLIRAGLSRKSAGRTRNEKCWLWVAPASVCHLGQLASSPNKEGRIIVLTPFSWVKWRLLKVMKCCEVGENKSLKALSNRNNCSKCREADYVWEIWHSP